MIHSVISIFKPGTQEELTYNTPGEICITGPGVMLGYDRPEATAKALQVHADGKTWLHTGDIGYMSEDGVLYTMTRGASPRFGGGDLMVQPLENIVADVTGLKIRRVLAKMDVVVPGRVLDDNDVVLVEYEGGATGCYWTSQFAIGHDNDLRVRIYGENGSILWAQEECEKVTMIDRDGTIVERHRGGGGIEPAAAKYGRLPAGHTEGWLESMGNLYRSFMECLHAKKDGTFEPGSRRQACRLCP